MNYYLIIFLILIFIFIHIKNYNKLNIFPIRGQLYLNRVNIWKNVKNKYGLNIASTIFPRTYILPKDINQLVKDKNKYFILKKLWSSLRINIDLFNNKTNILKQYHKYDVAQVYLTNPLLENGHKPQLRIYMVMDCKKGAYLFPNGYFNYTNKPFDLKSLDKNKKLSNINPSLQFYIKNNLSLDLNEFCQKHKINIKILLNKLVKYLKIILDSSPILCEKYIDYYKYNLYGIDVIILDNLNVKILEINANPGKSFKIKWKTNLYKKILLDIKRKSYKEWLKIKSI